MTKGTGWKGLGLDGNLREICRSDDAIGTRNGGRDAIICVTEDWGSLGGWFLGCSMRIARASVVVSPRTVWTGVKWAPCHARFASRESSDS